MFLIAVDNNMMKCTDHYLLCIASLMTITILLGLHTETVPGLAPVSGCGGLFLDGVGGVTPPPDGGGLSPLSESGITEAAAAAAKLAALAAAIMGW